MDRALAAGQELQARHGWESCSCSPKPYNNSISSSHNRNSNSYNRDPLSKQHPRLGPQHSSNLCRADLNNNSHNSHRLRSNSAKWAAATIATTATVLQDLSSHSR